ncbi:MAG TPA: hypothetical protein VED01_03775 [Burkholderiales bacterium]|nr:hypothetical protein [Burkholderiales bacterium]
MKILNKRNAVIRLGGYLPLIRSVFLRAWAEYNALPLELRIKLTPRSRASIVHDFVVHAIRASFDGIDDVRLLEINKLFVMLVGCDVVLRFKKLDDGLRASSIPTQQSLDFSNQDDLPGIERVTHLDAGYRLNALQTTIEGVYVCCPNGASVLWYYEIAPEEGEADNVIPLPRPNAPFSGAQITPLGADASKTQSDDDGES